MLTKTVRKIKKKKVLQLIKHNSPSNGGTSEGSSKDGK